MWPTSLDPPSHDNMNDDRDKVAWESSTKPSTSSSIVPALLITGAIGTIGGVLALTLPFVVLPGLLGQSLPYMATPSSKVQKALQYIIQHRRQQTRASLTVSRIAPQGDVSPALAASIPTDSSPRRFLDLGSGDGETVLQAVRLLHNGSGDGERSTPYYTHCVGVELNATLYLVSILRRALFWSYCQRRRSRFYCRNIFHLSSHMIQEADTIFIFGIPSLMTRLSQHLAQQGVRPGTLILSYRFPLPIDESVVDDTRQSDSKSDVTPLQAGSVRASGPHTPLLLPAALVYHTDEMHIYECTAMTLDQMVADAGQVTVNSPSHQQSHPVHGPNSIEATTRSQMDA